MAMRPNSRIGGTTPGRPRPAAAAVVQPVYEDFRPTTEWQQDEESNSLLLIYLPGFQREHLKVSTEGRNILRARGERLISGNKWSRFQENYQLPEDCNVRGIRAKFEGGILTLVIPRKHEAKEAPKTTQDTPKAARKTEIDLSSLKQPNPTKAGSEKTHQEAADDIPGQIGIPSVSALGKGRRNEITQETLPDQRMPRNLNEKMDETKKESDYQKIAQKVEKLEDQSAAIKKTIEESKAQKNEGDSTYKDLRPLKADKPEKSKDESGYPKDARKMKIIPDKVPDLTEKTKEKSKQGSDYQKSAKEIEEVKETKVKPKLQKDKGEVLEPTETKTTAAAGASSSTDYRLARYKQTVKRFLDINEERQLLVNVGAAVLVIVAFGAYLSCTVHEKTT